MLYTFSINTIKGAVVRMVPSLKPFLLPDPPVLAINNDFDDYDTDDSGAMSPVTDALFYLENAPPSVPGFNIDGTPLAFLQLRLEHRANSTATLNPITDRTALITASNSGFRRARKSSEKLLIKSIYPIFKDAIVTLDNTLELVDSEDDPFLPVPGRKIYDIEETFHKPDLHVIHRALWTATKPSVGGIVFGKTSVNCIRDMISILEGKIDPLTNTQIGTLMKYLHYWYYCRGVRAARSCVSGIVFYDKDFVYCEYNGCLFANFLRCGWADPGSRALFVRLVVELPTRTTFSGIVDAVCAVFNVTINSGSFLGRGIEGTVLDVCDENGTHYAIKIYSGGHHAVRAQMVQTAHATLAGVPGITNAIVHSVGAVQSVNGASGFLLSEVGLRVKRSDFQTKAAALSLLRLLRVFHVAGYCHGDARLANIVNIGGVLKWIDLSTVVQVTPAGIVADLVSLTNSIRRGHRKKDYRWPNVTLTEQCVQNYSNAPGNEAMFKTMAEFVSSKFYFV